jgi:transposase
MQNNARGHAARDTLAFIRGRSLIPIFWPTLSPNLNVIKTLWNRIKDIIKERDPKIHRLYLKLKAAIIKAWNLIIDEEIRDLIRTMHNRCQAVIDADGWHIKY